MTKRKKTTRRKRTAKKKKAKRKAKPSTAIVKMSPAPPVQRRPWALRPEQVGLLKRTVAKGTTDDEFALFLWVAKKHKLDPMTRQLHAVKRWSKAENRKVMAIQIGIDGYRSLAARNHPDYGGVDEPEYESAPGGGLLLARVRVWKKGFEHPTVAVAFWAEYAPLDLGKPEAWAWAKMPKGQLGKCAEALALRKAYPDLSDIYADEEMAQADDDYSEQGREITVEGHRPSDAKVIEASNERHAEVVRELGVKPQPAPPKSEASPAEKAEPPWEEDRRIIRATFKRDKVELTGATFTIKDDLKAKFGARWNAPIKGWTVAPSWLQDVKDLCEENGIELEEA